jgi:branched-chain amino acid aminotransferase
MLRQLRPRGALFQQSPLRLTAAWEALRTYSTEARLADIEPSKLSITKTTTPKELVPPNELVFGRTFTGTPPTH